MKNMRILTAMVLAASVAITSYAWLQHFTWQPPKLLRTLELEVGGRRVASGLVTETVELFCYGFLFHDSQAYAKCSTREQSSGLWRIDFSTKQARLIDGLPSIYKWWALPKDDHTLAIVALSAEDKQGNQVAVVGILGAHGWLRQPVTLFKRELSDDILALGWRGDALHVLATKLDKATHYRQLVEFVVSNTVTSQVVVVPGLDSMPRQDFSCSERLVHFHRGQWEWLCEDLSTSGAAQIWINQHFEKRPALAAMRDVSMITTGKIFDFATEALVDPEGPVISLGHNRYPIPIKWVGAKLMPWLAERTDAISRLYNVGGTAIDLRLRRHGSKDAPKWDLLVGDDDDVYIAQLSRPSDMIAVPGPSKDTYVVIDDNGNYATLDKHLHRIDPPTVLQYLRLQPNAVRNLRVTLFSLPPFVLVGVLLSLRRRKSSSPQTTIHSASWLRVVVAQVVHSRAMPVALLVNVAVAGYCLLRLLPLFRL